MSDQNQEYQAAYDAEMNRLNSAAEQSTTAPDAASAASTAVDATDAGTTGVTETSQADAAPPAGTTAETDAEMRARLDSMERQLADTKRWAHSNAAEVARLKREAEERQRAANRPEILDNNPGLEDAIRYVHQPEAPQPDPRQSQQVWLDTVSAALPDVDRLLGESEGFRQAVAQRAAAMGAEWNDPIAATRELARLQSQHLSQQAVAQAMKDFQAKQKKSTAMQVPSGSAARAPAQMSEVDRINNMSSAEFNAMRNKTLGF